MITIWCKLILSILQTHLNNRALFRTLQINRGQKRAVHVLPCHHATVWKSLMSACHYCTGIHLGPVSCMPLGRRGQWTTCSWTEWLIDQQTDDLNEWRERIKCLLSSPFIPLSCPPFISPSFQGGGACEYRGCCWEEVGPFLAGCGNQWGYYY